MKSTFEIERRFLVTDPTVVDEMDGNIIVQGYLFSDSGYVVRVRRTHYPSGLNGRYEEGPAILATKGPKLGLAREEYELEIPPNYAAELMARAPYKISKERYQLVENRNLWDIDVFQGDNSGLIIAEFEGSSSLDLEVPTWCGQEVTGDQRYANERLAADPYSKWLEW